MDNNGSLVDGNNCSVFTDEELVQFLLDEGDLSMTLALRRLVPLTIAYVLILVTGVFGNVVNCVVITCDRSMRTTTNLYLLNLSCSDLLTLLLGLPIELWSFYRAYPWVFGEWFCIARNAAAETTTTVSILTITALSAERYYAVSRPLRIRTASSEKRVLRVLVLVWLLALLVSAVLATQFGVIYLHDANGCVIEQSALCGVKQERVLRYSFELSTIMFVLPMLAIIVFCTLIAVTLRRSQKLRTLTDVTPLHTTGKLCRCPSERTSTVSMTMRHSSATGLAPPAVKSAGVRLRVSYSSASSSATHTKFAVNRMLCKSFTRYQSRISKPITSHLHRLAALTFSVFQLRLCSRLNLQAYRFCNRHWVASEEFHLVAQTALPCLRALILDY